MSASLDQPAGGPAAGSSQPRVRYAVIAPYALLPQGWTKDVLLVWDAAGTLTGVTPGAGVPKGVRRVQGVLVPGMPNVHSHAFQRAFAGLAEVRGAEDDGFWTWRQLMYRFASAITPQQLEDIATAVYIEMLAAGYTSVCEFHYLHHDPRGEPYADRAELGMRLVAAARNAGIGLTLLPVLYRASGFGGTEPLPGQARFVCAVDELLSIVQRLSTTGVRVGLAPHSLRAVPPPALAQALAAMREQDATAPVHIHVAEQRREVEACRAWSGQTPVQWLLDHADVDERWCLVHATHAGAEELRAVSTAGAVIGLCPTTEANLGDGLFEAPSYLAVGGRWGIGSDSQVSVDVAEELRWLEYGQRLAGHCRQVFATAQRPQVAERLWLGAVAGGAQASGRPIAGLEPGQRADWVVLDDEGLAPGDALAAHVFSHGPRRAVREVCVGGVSRVTEGRHVHGTAAWERFIAARAALLAGA